MDASIASERQRDRRRLGWAGFLLGFALGGFFDGIVLHQVLQWHHLLSGLEGEAFRDIRVQILADGLFHAAMYGVAAVGLWLLFRSRGEFAGPGADRWLLAALLIGFGVWHVIDAVLVHWILALHRIRMDVPNPLAWDIGWLVVFGLPPLLLGLGLRRRGGDRPPGEPPSGGPRDAGTVGLPVILAAAVVLGGAFAGKPPAADAAMRTTTVVLRPDVAPARFLAAVADQDFSIVWGSADGGVWVIRLAEGASPWRLYGHGALYVSGSVLPAGCSAWITA